MMQCNANAQQAPSGKATARGQDCIMLELYLVQRRAGTKPPTSFHSNLPTPMAAQVSRVPPAAEQLLDPEDFVPSDFIDILREDSGSCRCGSWHFYSSTCSHLYQTHPLKCGW